MINSINAVLTRMKTAGHILKAFTLSSFKVHAGDLPKLWSIYMKTTPNVYEIKMFREISYDEYEDIRP